METQLQSDVVSRKCLQFITNLWQPWLWSEEHFDLVLTLFPTGFNMNVPIATSDSHAAVVVITLFPSMLETDQLDTQGKSD